MQNADSFGENWASDVGSDYPRPGAAEAALAQWLSTAPGQCMQAWQQAQFDEWLPDFFGFHAVQLGLPFWDAMQASRVGRKWRYSEVLEAPDGAADASSHAYPHASPHVYGSFAALPFAERSLDVVLCPHTLELSPDPHATLREIARVLMPEGRLVLTGFNSASLWGLRQRRARFFRRILGERLALRLGLGRLFLPDTGEFIAYWRLRDWLRLLDFDIVDTRFGCYRFALHRPERFSKWVWMERLGERFWPILGASYAIVAVKRVPGTRLLKADWKNPQRIKAARPSAVRSNANTSSNIQSNINIINNIT